MTTWNPAETRKKFNLYLSEIEKQRIRERLAEPADDGNLYADAVFEGGGVKGTAFIGALRCFDEVGIKWRKVAGASAGAITAAMLSTQFPIDELEAIVAGLDYTRFLTKKTSPLILNGSPDNDLQNPLRMIANLFVVREEGQYSSEPFKQWMSGVLEGTVPTFAPFLNDSRDTPWYLNRALKVIVSDISRREMLVLPDDLAEELNPKTFSVAEAVRLSMSIPLFFEPGYLLRPIYSPKENGARGSNQPQPLQKSTIVDGGISSNFPLWLYDAPPNKRPKCPTFGFQLVEEGAKKYHEINGVTEVIGGVLETMLEGRDRRLLRLNDQGRVLDINTLGVSTTNFDLSNELKASLYREGYETARKFLNTWSWKEHLALRGFPE